MSPTLTRSLKGAVEDVEYAFDSLLKLELRSALDDASVSMILPCLSRATMSHQFSARLRRSSAAIVGAMATKLCDEGLSQNSHRAMMTLLQRALLDADPGVREVSAKAISTAHGNELRETPLFSWMLGILNSGTSTWVEKSGSAQAIAGICAKLPVECVEVVLRMAHVTISGTDNVDDENMETVSDSHCASKNSCLQASQVNYQHDSDQQQQLQSEGCQVISGTKNPHVYTSHSGGLQLIAALAQNNGNQRVLFKALPFVVQGFASPSDIVREAALNAGNSIICNAGLNEIQYALSLLGKELMNQHWRSRLGAVQLFGSLIRCGLSDTIGKQNLQFPEAELEQRLGSDQTHEYFSALYLLRSEPIEELAEAASTVWKATVTNSPRLLRRIMPTLIKRIVMDLGDLHSAQQAWQTRALYCLEELSSKVAEFDGIGAVKYLLPPLQHGIRNGTDIVKRGSIIALASILTIASKQQLIAYQNQVVPVIAKVLSTFSFTDPTLQKALGEILRVFKRIDGCLVSVIETLMQSWDRLSSFPPGMELLVRLEGPTIFPVILRLATTVPCLRNAQLVLWSSQFLSVDTQMVFCDSSLTVTFSCLRAAETLTKFDWEGLEPVLLCASSYSAGLSKARIKSDNMDFLDMLLSKTNSIKLQSLEGARGLTLTEMKGFTQAMVAA